MKSSHEGILLTPANADFCVINGEGEPLLGRETATNLGILNIQDTINILGMKLGPVKLLTEKKNLLTSCIFSFEVVG